MVNLNQFWMLITKKHLDKESQFKLFFYLLCHFLECEKLHLSQVFKNYTKKLLINIIIHIAGTKLLC